MTPRKKIKNLKIIPLGGFGEVGRNMMVLEYGKDILIVDVGLRFPEEDMPGIDFIIPNIKYLENKQKNIVGIVFTHGHYDHIGALPYLLDKLGNPPLYASPLTRGIILRRQEEFPGGNNLNITIVKPGDRITLGVFKVEFLHVNHNIPDDVALAISTPEGMVVHTSDFKFDPTPIHDKPADTKRLAQIGSNKVLLLMSDSTGAELPGHSISEKTIQENLEEIFKIAKGRIIAATFSSLINRIQQLITISEKYGRKVIIEGYSMKINAELAKSMGYLKIKKGTLIPAKDINNYPPSRITVVCTGAQGEGNAMLMKIANKEHRYITAMPGDSIIFSSSVIPGNERTVQTVKDSLYRRGATVFHYKMMDIHAGGHAQEEDLIEMIQLIKPKFFIPIHGQYSMLVNHANIAEKCSIPRENIKIIENGHVVNVNRNEIHVEKKRMPCGLVMVDGLGVGDVGNVVLRDRQVMSKDGMFVIIAIVDSRNGKVRGNPDIISRGFVYLRENKKLLAQTREKTKQIVETATGDGSPVNWVYIKNNIRDKIGHFLYSKTQRRPMVLPVVIEV